jgi:hypothetical protein
MRRSTRWVFVLALVGILAFVIFRVARPYVRAASFVIRSAGLQDRYPRLGALETQPYTEEAALVPTRLDAIRARLYRPSRRVDRAVLLVPGINALAIEEPRLVRFARELAASGMVVLTPEVPDLKNYLVTPRSTDMIEDAAVWLLKREDLTRGKRIGLIGISFAGGLSVVAAGRLSIRDHVEFMFSFGGHSDFQRVARYLVTGQEAAAPRDAAALCAGVTALSLTVHRKPHDYGVAVMALDVAHLLVPPDQVKDLKTAILKFLEASHLALYDKRRAQREFERARELERGLREPAATMMHDVNTRNVDALGKVLLPYLPALGDDPALSPAKSPPPPVPVFLLHGVDDNVVPAVESLLLADYLRGKTPVRCLLSPLISHAEVDRTAKAGDIWQLVSFWAALLRA